MRRLREFLRAWRDPLGDALPVLVYVDDSGYVASVIEDGAPVRFEVVRMGEHPSNEEAA